MWGIDRIFQLWEWLLSNVLCGILVYKIKSTPIKNKYRKFGTHGSWVPSVAPITVGRLNEDGCFRETLGIDLAPDVVKPDPLADVPTGLLHNTIAVHVGEKPQTEPLKNRDRLHHITS